MTTRMRSPRGRRLRAIGAAALAAAIALSTTSCSKDEQPLKPLTSACRTASALIGNLRVADRSGIYQPDDLSAAPSAYQTTWRLETARVAHIQVLSSDDLQPVRRTLLKVAVGPETSDADPGLEGLELRATAALGLASLQLEPSQKLVVARMIEGYRVHNEYRLTRTEEPSAYATFLAATALRAIGAQIPEEVRRSLAADVAELPKADYSTLDDVIIPRAGAYVAAGGDLRGLIPKRTLTRWLTIATEGPQDALSLSLASNIYNIAQGAGVKLSVDEKFSGLASDGGWATQSNGPPDPKITYYATVMGLHTANLKGFLSSGRGQGGCLPQSAQPSIQGAYLAERVAELCPSTPKLNSRRLESNLREESASGTSLLDLGRLCHIEKKRDLSIVPHAALKSQFHDLAQHTMSFEDAVELRLASTECDIPVYSPVSIEAGVHASRYYYVGAKFLKTTKAWGGTTSPVTTKPLDIPARYELILNSVLKAPKATSAEVGHFRCASYYCGIAKHGRGDASSAAPTVAAFVVALEGLHNGDRVGAILAGT